MERRCAAADWEHLAHRYWLRGDARIAPGAGDRSQSAPEFDRRQQRVAGRPSLHLGGVRSGQLPRRPFPISPISPTRSPPGSSIYHAFQAKVERRFSKGLSILAAYTYSKSIDTASGPFSDSRNANFPQNSYDVAAEKAVSDFNFPQRLSLAYLWTMPFGSTTAKLQNQQPQLPDSGLGGGERAHRRVRPAFYSGRERERQRRGRDQ